MKDDFVYNGAEQSVNDYHYWEYSCPDNYKTFDSSTSYDILFPLEVGYQDWTDVFEFTSGSSATNAGTYAAKLKLKNTKRYRWSAGTDADSDEFSKQWVIGKYYLTADCSESNDVLGGSANAPTSLTVPVKDVYNDDCYIVYVTGVRNHMNESDFTIETGRPYEFDGKSDDSWNNTTTLRWKFYPQFTAANQSRSITIRLTDSARTNYEPYGYFKFTFTSGTFHT